MERTRLKKIINKGLQIAFPLFLGAAILIWMYHGFNFSRVWEVLDGGMNYGWMLVSLVFGVFSHIFRGWRWKLTLAPLGEHPKTSDCVYAIFVSYAANLVVPRVGEISRCGVLAKYDGTSFSKSLGTVVTERLIDTLMELQKKESTDLPLLKKQLAETEKGINNMLNASEPHMAKVTCFSAVLNGKTKYRRIRQ